LAWDGGQGCDRLAVLRYCSTKQRREPRAGLGKLSLGRVDPAGDSIPHGGPLSTGCEAPCSSADGEQVSNLRQLLRKSEPKVFRYSGRGGGRERVVSESRWHEVSSPGGARRGAKCRRTCEREGTACAQIAASPVYVSVVVWELAAAPQLGRQLSEKGVHPLAPGTRHGRVTVSILEFVAG
jgi:hypothetical protein